ncbi:MAG: hypothetical protein IJO56_03685 [Oscillospiraceae bacterium]|nr:hypothetical protein [Oscillospiraceae bacterium]
MKTFKKASELLWVLGIVFVALGVTVCSKADLGVSMIAAPAFIMHEFMSQWFGWLTVGVVEYIIQGIMLVLLCCLIRRFRWRYLLAFAVAVIYGYTLDLCMWLLRDLQVTAVWQRWCMLLLGDTITALGVACFFRTYLPLQVYELFVAELANRFRLNINKTKSVYDIALLVISVMLAIFLFNDIAGFDWSAIAKTSFHQIGLGTIVTTIINAPIITMTGRLIDRLFEKTPRFPKLASLLGQSTN